MRIAASAALVLSLAGCGGGEERSPLNDAALGDALERLAEARPEPKSAPPSPALIEIPREDLAGELRPGSGGCDFSDAGKLLFAAVPGDAVARVNGRTMHFIASGTMGPSGGYFTAGTFSISIGRLTDAGVTVEGMTTWPAGLVLTDRSREEDNELRLDGAWRCAS